jgi:hypothetical protein
MLSLAGCSGAKGAAVPQGQERFDKHGFSFTYPSGWQVKEEPGAGGQGRALFVTGPDSPARVPPQVAVGWERADVEFDALLLMDKVKIGRPGMQISVNEATQVPGAKNAHRIEATYPLEDMTGADRTIRSVYLFLEGDDHQMLDVVVRAPAEDFDRYGLADVVRSFRLS